MKLIIGWSVFVGIVWGIAVVTLTVLANSSTSSFDSHGLLSAVAYLQAVGSGLGGFIAPVLQLGLILYVLLVVGERLGFGRTPIRMADLELATNVQSVIAVVVIVAFAIAALTRVGDIGALKDICLVVVGFYFGTRRHQADSQADAVVAGAAGAAAVAARGVSPEVPQPSTEPPR